MASAIQVVLKENIEKLGKVGDLVKVKRGYARNYLIPRALAFPATRSNISRIEHERKAILVHAEKTRKDAESVAERLSSLTIQIAKPAGNADKLYGSVTAKEVAEALAKEGIPIDRKTIEFSSPIKTVGEFTVTAKLGSGVKANIKLVVVKQG